MEHNQSTRAKEPREKLAKEAANVGDKKANNKKLRSDRTNFEDIERTDEGTEKRRRGNES